MKGDPERPRKGDRVYKGNETGVVVEVISPRTHKPYLRVDILSGPRKGRGEFPDRGWRFDLGYVPGNERPAYDGTASTMHPLRADKKTAPAPMPRQEPAPAHPTGCTCDECASYPF